MDPVTGDVTRATPNDDGTWVVGPPWKLVERSWFFELADKIGLRDAYALKERAPELLAPYIVRKVARRPAVPLPSPDDLCIWHEMLLSDDDAMRYLLHKRGLNREIVVKANIGYDGRAFTIPIKHLQTRQLVNLRRRYWPTLPASGAKYLGLPGRTLENGGVTVYPGMPGGAVILAAGEFDALVLWRHKLPGITVTSGAATRWRDEWAWAVEGRTVFVIYDADPREQEQAVSRAAELRRVGARACVVRLSKTGMSNGEDITDWFVKYRRTRADLVALIKREQRRTR